MGSSKAGAGCWPKEDHLRGEAAAEGSMLEGVLDPLSASLQCPHPSFSMGRAGWTSVIAATLLPPTKCSTNRRPAWVRLLCAGEDRHENQDCRG